MADIRMTDVAHLGSLSGDESFFINSNDSVKQINRSNIVFGVSNGGTGATTAEEARENLGAAPLEHTHTLDSLGAAAEGHTHEDMKNSIEDIESSMNDHINNKDNPHNVTAEQLGITPPQIRNIHIGTSMPTNSDGVNGDIWFVYGQEV